jgi:hypothetical protein
MKEAKKDQAIKTGRRPRRARTPSPERSEAERLLVEEAAQDGLLARPPAGKGPINKKIRIVNFDFFLQGVGSPNELREL